MMDDLAVQQPHTKQTTEAKPIDLPRVALRFVPRETKDFEAIFGLPDLALARRYLREQLYHRGFRDEVLAALDTAPRHVFAGARASLAYVDIALQSDHSFIQAPSTVATLVSTLSSPDARVLELGTGTGYQSAVLAAFGAQVLTIDSREDRALAAGDRFAKLDLNVQTLVSNDDPLEGIVGPFDLIVVNEGLRRMPRRLLPLVREGGSIIAPVLLADGTHRLMRYLRYEGSRVAAVDLGPCYAPVTQHRRKRP